MPFVAFFLLCNAAAAALVTPGLPPEVAADMPYVAIILGLAALLVAALMIGRGLAWLFVRTVAKRKPVIVVDGSNVMHWMDEVPKVKTLRLVLSDLTARGFAPHVFFDANVGYILWGRPIGARDLAERLNLNPSQITLAPSRTPADPLLIGYAITTGVRVVSNDRFMDWREEFPAIRGKGFLVPGKVKGDSVELRFVAREAA